jgi:hypothetical protein
LCHGGQRPMLHHDLSWNQPDYERDPERDNEQVIDISKHWNEVGYQVDGR